MMKKKEKRPHLTIEQKKKRKSKTLYRHKRQNGTWNGMKWNELRWAWKERLRFLYFYFYVLLHFLFTKYIFWSTVLLSIVIHANQFDMVVGCRSCVCLLLFEFFFCCFCFWYGWCVMCIQLLKSHRYLWHESKNAVKVIRTKIYQGVLLYLYYL